MLSAAFRVEVRHKQRRSDGTVSLEGGRFEIPSGYRHLERVNLQHAHWDMTRVDMADPRTGAILCAVKPPDKSASANGQRRRLAPTATDLSPLRPATLPALMAELLADYAAMGVVPPAYLPTTDKESNCSPFTG